MSGNKEPLTPFQNWVSHELNTLKTGSCILDFLLLHFCALTLHWLKSTDNRVPCFFICLIEGRQGVSACGPLSGDGGCFYSNPVPLPENRKSASGDSDRFLYRKQSEPFCLGPRDHGWRSVSGGRFSAGSCLPVLSVFAFVCWWIRATSTKGPPYLYYTVSFGGRNLAGALCESAASEMPVSV